MKKIGSISIISVIYRLWSHLTLRRRTQFFLLIFLMVICSGADLISIGLVVPFLGAFMSPDSLLSNVYINQAATFFNLNEKDLLIRYITIFFVVSVVISSLLRILLLWFGVRYSNSTGSEFSIEIYRNTLNKPYLKHIATNTSSVINGVINKSNSISSACITPLLRIFSAIIFCGILIAILIAINPLLMIATFLLFAGIYWFVMVITKGRLEKYGKLMALESTTQIKLLQEGLGGIRDIIINNNQSLFVALYGDTDKKLRNANANHEIISTIPRYIVEPLGVIAIVFFAYYLSLKYQPSVFIPTLGIIALCAQKMLPMLQQAYNSWALITGAKYSIIDAIELMDACIVPDIKSDLLPIQFNASIYLGDVSFKYSEDSKDILSGINLEIKKGQKIGLIGSTGSGKSTLIDILMGLFPPTKGHLYIDGFAINSSNVANWQARIAHVPQQVFLSDASIAENVAFGIPISGIDFQRVATVGRLSQIHEFVDRLPKKYLTAVGERGVKLSGGQRQRIAIARALYRGADFLVFDEATSALDSETEKLVMRSISELNTNITMVMIAHRISTLENCDLIFELNNGILKKYESYLEMVKIKGIR
ncbi:ABC transporter ATP-binding protein [Polynucleobacter paneuropaeus]|nr:ABC transporter ATP-binding protein [Polynucleobacter paneuropaeus]